MVVGILVFVTIVAGSLWTCRDLRKCSCGKIFRSAYPGRWRGRGSLQTYNHFSCPSCHAKQGELRETEIAKEREELEKVAVDSTVHVRQRLKARYAARRLGSRKV